MYLAAVVLFDAVPTGWVSKHNSVGLIPLQRRYSDTVAYSVGVSQNVLITALEHRRCAGLKIVFLGIIQSAASVFPHFGIV
jgi:hypothetical protein